MRTVESPQQGKRWPEGGKRYQNARQCQPYAPTQDPFGQKEHELSNKEWQERKYGIIVKGFSEDQTEPHQNYPANRRRALIADQCERNRGKHKAVWPGFHCVGTE